MQKREMKRSCYMDLAKAVHECMRSISGLLDPNRPVIEVSAEYTRLSSPFASAQVVADMPLSLAINGLNRFMMQLHARLVTMRSKLDPLHSQYHFLDSLIAKAQAAIDANLEEQKRFNIDGNGSAQRLEVFFFQDACPWWALTGGRSWLLCFRHRAAVAHRVRATMARCSTRGPCAAVRWGRQARRGVDRDVDSFSPGQESGRKARHRLTDLPSMDARQALSGVSFSLGYFYFTPGILPSALRASFAVHPRSCADVDKQKRSTSAREAGRNALALRLCKAPKITAPRKALDPGLRRGDVRECRDAIWEIGAITASGKSEPHGRNKATCAKRDNTLTPPPPPPSATPAATPTASAACTTPRSPPPATAAATPHPDQQ